LRGNTASAETQVVGQAQNLELDSLEFRCCEGVQETRLLHTGTDPVGFHLNLEKHHIFRGHIGVVGEERRALALVFDNPKALRKRHHLAPQGLPDHLILRFPGSLSRQSQRLGVRVEIRAEI
jgi:hypothetical protein